MKKISVVTPCYNEAENIEPFHTAITHAFSSLPYELEIVYVNDGSSDTSEERIRALSLRDPRVKYIFFAKNAGQQAATSAGLVHASGDAVMMMDVDLQHPPHLIPDFIERWEEGNEVVFGIRRARSDDSPLRGITSKIAATIIALGEGWRLPRDTSDFSIMDRSVVQAFKKLPPRAVMTRFQVARAARAYAFIPFDVPPRTIGESKYTYKKLLTLLWKSTFGKSLGTLPRYEIKETNIV